MSVAAKLQQPSTEAALGNLAARTKGLERQSHGHLIYVGTYPAGLNTTPESPPFQNSWSNIGGNYPPLAFCMGADGYVRLEGTCDGGADGTVVFTLPEGYRPDQSQRFVCALSSGSDFMTLQIDPNGDVTVVARGFDPGSGSIAADTITPGTDGQVLTTVLGVVQWAAPAAAAPSSTIIQIEDVLIGAEGTINYHQGAAIQISGTDDTIEGEIDLTIGVVPGAEGQVLTTVSGIATWQDPITPTPPAAVYPLIEVGGATIGSEPTINVVAENVVSIVGVHHAGSDVELDIGLTAGTNGQVMQTVGGVPAWADLIVGRTLQMELFGALPAAVGPTQVLRVPYVDGVARVFDVNRLFLRVETPGAGPTTVQLQKSSGTTAFIPTIVATVTVLAGANDGETTGALGTVASGDLIRMNFTALGGGAASFYAEFAAEEEV